MVSPTRPEQENEVAGGTEKRSKSSDNKSKSKKKEKKEGERGRAERSGNLAAAEVSSFVVLLLLLLFCLLFLAKRLPPPGIEPGTFCLQDRCSTTEPHRRNSTCTAQPFQPNPRTDCATQPRTQPQPHTCTHAHLHTCTLAHLAYRIISTACLSSAMV